jgi:hypothetical protein
MARYVCFLGLAVCAACSTGCVDRRFVVSSDPPGAVVFRNGQALGAAPVDDHFVYYGKYHFTLIKDGYQTLQVDQDVPAPWYEYFPLDFISENLVPWRITDARRYEYHMEPVAQPRTDLLLNDSNILRDKSRTLQPLTPPVAPVAAPGTTPAPPVAPPAAPAPAPAAP